VSRPKADAPHGGDFRLHMRLRLPRDNKPRLNGQL